MEEKLLVEVCFGKCFCGNVEFEVEGKHSACGNCHCDTCKHFYSAPFNTAVIYKKTGFKFTKGEDLTKTYDTGEVNRYFCGECGTRLVNLAKERNIASIPLSILRKGDNSRPKISPLGHVFYDKHLIPVPDLKFKVSNF